MQQADVGVGDDFVCTFPPSTSPSLFPSPCSLLVFSVAAETVCWPAKATNKNCIVAVACRVFLAAAVDAKSFGLANFSQTAGRRIVGGEGGGGNVGGTY